MPEAMSAADAGKVYRVFQVSLYDSSACRLKAKKIYSVTHYECVAIMAVHVLSLNQSMVSQQEHSLNRESLAEKRLSQISLSVMQTLAVYNFKHGHLVLGSCAGSNERR